MAAITPIAYGKDITDVGLLEAGCASTTTGSSSAGSSSAESLPGAPPRASLTFKDLAYEAPLPGGGSKTILAPCSGHFEPGELVAIMGPSGCGKTTLLDCLAMKKSGPYKGQVFVNGRARDATLFQRVAAYVGQEDRMPAHWRVREALEFNAMLKREPGAPREEARAMIDGLLETFGLAQVAESYIGGAEVRGISGGQRRRVSLARGVAAQASVLFCDEPTSGLSATDAETCVKALSAIAKRMQVLVLVVIHQPRPEVAELFDRLLLLTSGPGRVCYSGTMCDAPGYFASVGCPVPAYGNPADHLLDLVTPGTKSDSSEALVAAFAAHQRPGVEAAVEGALGAPGQTTQEMLQARAAASKETAGARVLRRARVGRYAAPFGEQVRVLLRRKASLTLRNPAAIGMQLGMPIGMGVVLGSIFQGVGRHAFGMPQITFVFILLTMLSLQSLPLMPLLIEERMHMKLETSERLYTEAAHILTTLCVTVPLSLAGAACQTGIIYAFSALPWEYFLPIVFWTLLLFFFFDALFSCVAAAAPDAQQAQTMATPFLVLFMLFNGAIVTKATAPAFLRWVFFVSPTGYALEAITLRLSKDAGELGAAMVHSMGYEAGNKSRGVALILCMTLALRVLQCLALKFLNNVRR